MFILLKYKVSKYDICLLGRSFVRFEGIEEKKAFFSNFFFIEKVVYIWRKKKKKNQYKLNYVLEKTHHIYVNITLHKLLT